MQLVSHPFYNVKRGDGGPGYLYNLKSGAEKYGPTQRVDIRVAQSVTAPPTPIPSLPKRVVRRIKHELNLRFAPAPAAFDSALFSSTDLPAGFAERFDHQLGWVRSTFDWMDKSYAERLFECDLLFAHESFFPVYLQNFCPKQAAEKLVIISHSPTWVAIETAANLMPNMTDDRLLQAKSV